MSGRAIEVDRFLVPTDAPDAQRYLLGALWAPHGVRERLLRAVRGLTGGRLVRLLGRRPDPAWRCEVEALEEVLASPLSDALPGERSNEGWLLLRGYPGRRRNRTTAFLFAEGAADGMPRAVIKLRWAGVGRNDAGASLAIERDALIEMGERLSAPLVGTVPPVLGHGCAGGREVLLLGGLPGRPAYVEARGTLAPRRHVGLHFRVAAEWLARFHQETAHGVWTPPPPAELELADPGPPWYRLLADAAAAGRLARVAAHGDFWARNLLVGDSPGALPGVVDWEEFRPSAGPIDDLFHFPISYGRIYPGPAYRPLRPVEVFDRVFLGRGPLARSVAAYLRLYARRRGLDPDLIEPLFRLDLRLRICRAAVRGGPGAGAEESEPRGGGRLRDLPWSEFERRFEAARTHRRGGGRSVFSG